MSFIDAVMYSLLLRANCLTVNQRLSDGHHVSVRGHTLTVCTRTLTGYQCPAPDGNAAGRFSMKTLALP